MPTLNLHNDPAQIVLDTNQGSVSLLPVLASSVTLASVTAQANAAAASAAAATAAAGLWLPTHAYATGDVAQAPDGSRIKRISAGTSRATFDSTEQALWAPVATTTGTLEQVAVSSQTATQVQRARTYYQYVDYVAGNDSNDGKSWGKAKKTLAAAKAALPTGGSGNHLGTVYLSDGDHYIGSVGSSATGFNQDQGLHVVGVAQHAGLLGGTRVIYVGTGIGWQTGKDDTSIFAATTLADLQIIAQNGTASILLDVRNAQNNCTFDRIIVGDTATGGNNPVTSALRVSVDASLASSGFPGFLHFTRCWFTGGSTPIDITPGVTGINFHDCGLDPLDDATVGFLVRSATSDAGATVRWMASKMEIHNGPNLAPTPALRVDSTTAQLEAGVHQYATAYVTAAGTSGISLAGSVTNDATHTSTTVTVPVCINAIKDRIISRKVYRTTAGGTTFKLLTTISDNTTTSYIDTTPDASLGANYAQGASGTAGNPYAFQIDSLCRFEIEGEARADTFCSSTEAIHYTAAPSSPSWPRGRYTLSTFNYPYQFKGASTALGGGTFPRVAVAANTNYAGAGDFLRTMVVRDLIFGGKAFSSIVTTGLGTGGSAVISTAVFNSNERRGQLIITIGTAPGANPTVAPNFGDQSAGNGGPTVLLTAATKSDGTASPSDWGSWQIDSSGTDVSKFRLKWCGAAAPTAANVYYLNYLVFA